MPRHGLLVALVIASLTATAVAENDVRTITAEGEGANYWPGWRGPSAQGYVEGSGYPDRWSD